MAPPAHARSDATKTYTESASSAADEDETAPTLTAVAARGRKMEREASDDDKGEPAESGDNGHNDAGSGVRKRKRSRKGLDKKYMCPHEDCGKSYSRAEHLYRHQLNHTPKQIYKCDFPDCPRWFVRQDLCARHRERHTTRGSHLQRKDGQGSEPSSAVDHRPSLPSSSPAHRNELSINTGSYTSQSFDLHSSHMQSPATDISLQQLRGPVSASFADTFRTQQPNLTNSVDAYGRSQLQRSNSDSHYLAEPTSLGASAQSGFGSGSARPAQLDALRYHHTLNSNGQYAITSPSDPPDSPRHFKRHSAQLSSNHGQSASSDFANFAITPQLTSIPSISPQVYTNSASTMTGLGAPQQSSGYGTGAYGIPTALTGDGLGGFMSGDALMTDISMGGFDTDDYARSPTVITDNFTAWLFNEPSANIATGHRQDAQLVDPSLRVSPPNGGPLNVPSQDPMAVASILGSSAPGSVISESKRQSFLELIRTRFNETQHSAVVNQKDRIFSGNIDHESHVLSLRSLQTYIGSYWYHFHDQMPILHRPTFSADNSQNLLLVAVIAIGAANLDKMHGQEKTSAGAELANFLAWHLRGELFMDKDFPPPTKLWVLQALLLLEAYEKLSSSRVLHERSQIHHATTISLLRRGSALLGRSALDSPPNEEENSYSIADTPDPWWNHWITTEATKRVALAAFSMDSIHATMFNHTAVMVAHEMRLRLPCDEALWAATSGVEVSRLREEHGDPVAFLDGLKGTLNGRPIRTNSFGRVALMAGLLNVSFHLSQRDQQVRSLGVELGGKDRWRGTLTKAFDIWERNWDNGPTASGTSAGSGTNHEPPRFQSTRWQGSGNKATEQLFESRVVLHHLAHMGMHVDIVQCQIYAGAHRLLGRTITPPDRANAERRMREMWAPSASARDAVFYSLRFLRQVLAPYLTPGAGDGATSTADSPGTPGTAGSAGSSSGAAPGSSAGADAYSPRDDYLLHRPWVLYFAALVVWSYGFALDGALPRSSLPDSLPTTHAAQCADLRAFMARVGAVARPDDLAHVAGRNRVVGLLGVLITSFRRCRWELLREAATRLADCVQQLKGRPVSRGIEAASMSVV